MKALAIAVALAACVPPPQQPPAAPQCAGVRATLAADATAVTEACLAAFARTAPDQVAAELAPLGAAELGGLGRFHLDAADWLAVATRIPPDRPAAAAVFALVLDPARGGDDVRVAARIHLLRAAGARHDDTAVRAQVAELARIEHVRSDIVIAVIDALERVPARDAVAAVCAHNRGPATAWACLAADRENFEANLDACAKLPVIQYKDIGRVRSADQQQRGLLRGLACSDDDDPFPRRYERGTIPASTPLAAVTIYTRLAATASERTARCLRKAAAFTCLGLLESGRECLESTAVAQYARTLEKGPELHEFIADLVDLKAHEYALLSRGAPGAREMLFHLHVTLAAILTRGRPSGASELWLPAYHAASASMLWTPDPNLTLRDFFPRDVRAAVCAPTVAAECRATCAATGCPLSCANVRSATAEICRP